MLSLIRHVGEEIPLATEEGFLGVLRVLAVNDEAALISFELDNGATVEHTCRLRKDVNIQGADAPLGSIRIVGLMPPKARIGFDFPKTVLIDQW